MMFFYLRDLIMAYKCVNNLAPAYLCHKFHKRSTIHSLATRKRDTLEIPLLKTATGQQAIYLQSC